MNVIMSAIAMALLVSATSVASAVPLSLHRHTIARDYDAYSPRMRPRTSVPSDRDVANGASDESHDTATGGPVGGIN